MNTTPATSHDDASSSSTVAANQLKKTDTGETSDVARPRETPSRTTDSPPSLPTDYFLG